VILITRNKRVLADDGAQAQTGFRIAVKPSVAAAGKPSLVCTLLTPAWSLGVVSKASRRMGNCDAQRIVDEVAAIYLAKGDKSNSAGH
jgi:hypothetical protein